LEMLEKSGTCVDMIQFCQIVLMTR